MTQKANALKDEAVVARKKAKAQEQTAKDSAEFAAELQNEVVKARQAYAAKAWKANVLKVEAAKQAGGGAESGGPGGAAGAGADGDGVLMNKKRTPLSRATDLDEDIEHQDEDFALKLEKDVEIMDPEIDLTARFKPWPKSTEE